MASNMFKDFSLTDSEWQELEKKYGNLLNFQSWQLIKMNSKNSHTDEFRDVRQEQAIAMWRAGCYHKRQIYIENCFKVVRKHAKDPDVLKRLDNLEYLWNNKTRHGAGKVKYGDVQQEELELLVKETVPPEERPNKNQPLNIDKVFVRYFKAITWNSKKNMGKKITREKDLRSGMVSLSEYECLYAS